MKAMTVTPEIASDLANLFDALSDPTRILPRFIRDGTEGAGFNIGFFVFFAFPTEGRTMTMEQAIEYALKWTKASPS
jgi:hypothetical protein